MNDQDKSKEELLTELLDLRRRVSELESAEVERERAEEDLRRSEARFRAVVENIGEGIVFLDVEANVLYGSPSYYKVNGYSDEERVGRNGFELIHPDDIDATRSIWGEMIHHPEMRPRVEYRIRHKDGGWRWVETAGQNLLGALDVQAIILTTHDITERKQAEETLQARNRYIETIMESAPIGFAVRSMEDGSAHFVSSRFEEIYGVPRGSFSSFNNFFEIVYPDPVEREAMRTRVATETASGDPKRMVWENMPVHLESGEVRYVTATGIPIPSQNVIVSTVQDMTERVKAIDALQKSEAVFRAVVENSHDGIVMMDSERRVKYVSSSYQHLSGYAPEEIIGASGIEYVHPDDRAMTAAGFAELLKTPGASRTVQYRLRHKNGTWIWIETTATNLLDDPQAQAVVLSSRDITERKSAEEAMRQHEADIQRSALEERQRIARDLHDAVSQTLFSASFTSEMLLQQRKTITPRELWKNIKHLSMLVTSALSEMRILLLELRPESLAGSDLPTLLQHLKNAANARSKAKVALEAKGKHEIPVEPKIAFYRIAQEALNNSIKHANCTKINIHLSSQAGSVELCVEDNGTGFDLDKNAGMKMGLNIMRERANQIGADLKVISKVKKGSQVICKWDTRGKA